MRLRRVKTGKGRIYVMCAGTQERRDFYYTWDEEADEFSRSWAEVSKVDERLVRWTNS